MQQSSSTYVNGPFVPDLNAVVYSVYERATKDLEDLTLDLIRYKGVKSSHTTSFRHGELWLTEPGTPRAFSVDSVYYYHHHALLYAVRRFFIMLTGDFLFEARFKRDLQCAQISSIIQIEFILDYLRFTLLSLSTISLLDYPCRLAADGDFTSVGGGGGEMSFAESFVLGFRQETVAPYMAVGLWTADADVITIGSVVVQVPRVQHQYRVNLGHSTSAKFDDPYPRLPQIVDMFTQRAIDFNPHNSSVLLDHGIFTIDHASSPCTFYQAIRWYRVYQGFVLHCLVFHVDRPATAKSFTDLNIPDLFTQSMRTWIPKTFEWARWTSALIAVGDAVNRKVVTQQRLFDQMDIERIVDGQTREKDDFTMLIIDGTVGVGKTTKIETINSPSEEYVVAHCKERYELPPALFTTAGTLKHESIETYFRQLTVDRVVNGYGEMLVRRRQPNFNKGLLVVDRGLPSPDLFQLTASVNAFAGCSQSEAIHDISLQRSLFMGMVLSDQDLTHYLPASMTRRVFNELHVSLYLDYPTVIRQMLGRGRSFELACHEREPFYYYTLYIVYLMYGVMASQLDVERLRLGPTHRTRSQRRHYFYHRDDVRLPELLAKCSGFY